ncbi:ABC transporter permease/substrate-binding protein [Sphingobacterium arenae]|uniref:ABC transporter permease/substrate-binding protein n=1 Tax=Sphingobacterium arenae TaxID=1280598 RepID=A0ABR7XY69_9SPHI|nr:ABC transporter permease/substrate-binding protein [Sphingobacterium arenae]MBD1423994.1 ABC transporter permease/substrate-binding protein [Sphingobacterium arenae]
MNDKSNLWDFVASHWEKLLGQTGQHIGLTFMSISLAIIVGVPMGILISRKRNLSPPILGFAGVLQTIPSLALLGLLIPVLGIGAKPAIAALFLYGLLPIIRNTYTGITNIDPEIKEAASGLGMSYRQSLLKVELPLAMPVILAGIRIATIVNVGVATLAAYIAAGGLGEFIFGGISLNNTTMMLAGAIPAAILALLFDFVLSRLQKIRFRKIAGIFSIMAAIVLLSGFYIIPSLDRSKLLAGFTPEFMGRADGYVGLKQIYGLNIPTVVINDAVMYKAIFEKKLDVVSGYGTDGRIDAYQLVSLEDDRKIFPPYYAAPIIKEQTLRRFPELEPVLNLLAGRINDSIMTFLNYQVDYKHREPADVAREFLEKQNLYKPPRPVGKNTIRIGSKVFDEQYILASLYTQLIRGYTDLDVSPKTGLGGTKICFDALMNDQIDLYPEYTGTGLTVMLQADSATVRRLGADKEAVYDYVQTAFNEQYQVKWLKPVGFNNTYAVMMRKEDVQRLGIRTISDLSGYLNVQK